MGKGKKGAPKSTKKPVQKAQKLAVFIPRETQEGETRVAGTPETIKTLVQHGLAVYVETGAGERSSILDQEYMQAGAVIGKDTNALYASADVILSVNPPTESPLSQVKENVCWISFLDISSDTAKNIAKTLVDKKISSVYTTNCSNSLTR